MGDVFLRSISRNTYSFLQVGGVSQAAAVATVADEPTVNSPDLDLNSSASDLLRDCVGAFPPFVLGENSILPIQTASAQGEMPLETYRRLRLCRAVGALPYTAAITAGLSSEEDGAQARSDSGQITGGQFRGAFLL